MTMQFAASPDKLLIVYNADSGLINALMHAVHKQLFPETYPCSLCAITYGAVSMHGEWKRFLESLPMDVVFHHKDDFTEAYPEIGTDGAREVALPAILTSRQGEEPQVLIPAEELDAMKDTVELMARVEEQLAEQFLREPNMGRRASQMA